MRTLISVGVCLALAGAAATSLAACSSPSTEHGDVTGLTIIAGSTDTPSPSGSTQASDGVTSGTQLLGGGTGSASASAVVGTATSRARGTSPSTTAAGGKANSPASTASAAVATSAATTGPAAAPPSVVSFQVLIQPTCSAGGGAGKPVRLAWQVANATEADLSADAPAGDVGSLRKGLPTSGWVDVAFTCSGAPGSTETHVFDLYAVSGSNHPFSELSVSAKVPVAPTPTPTTSASTPPSTTTTTSSPTTTPSAGL